MVGLKTWVFGGANKTPRSGLSNDDRKIHGRISMFITGFIMLTPHRIALTCAPHVLKRYHLSPSVVPLFIYKIHAPMELSSFIGQLITNIIVWIVRGSGAPKWVFRGISIFFGWTLFFSGVLSFILFKSGNDYGNFDYFFWSVILMTLTNGWFSASTFKLEGFYASMYGAGLPASGFFTFFLHKYCKWLSKRNDWEDFDHSIVMIQFWSTIITLGITTACWTIDIGMDIADTIPGGSSNSSIDFGNSGETSNKLQTEFGKIIDKYEVKLEQEANATGYKARPDTSGRITVSAVNDTTNTYKGFKHRASSGNMTVNRITIHGHITESIRQNDIESITFNTNGGVYVYFAKDDDSNNEKPYLICLSDNGRVSQNNKWYNRTGTHPNYTWKIHSGLGNQDPNEITGNLLTQLGDIKSTLESASDTGYPKSGSIEIDISQAPVTGNDGGFYKSGGVEIQVTKVQVNNAQSNESEMWRCYKHSRSPSGDAFTLKKILHSDRTMQSTGSGQKQLSDNMSEDFRSVTGVYVYYNDLNQINQPRVICISVDGTTSKNKWYKAGTAPDNWADATATFSSTTPTTVTDTQLNTATQNSTLTVPGGTNYVIKLDKRPSGSDPIKYRTKDIITVSKGFSAPSNYVSYVHKRDDDWKFTLGSVKHNDQVLSGVQGGTGVTAVYVYYESTNDTEHQFPLIVCVKRGQNSQTYHKRGNNWAEENNLKWVDPDGLDPDKEPVNEGIRQLFVKKEIKNTVKETGHAAEWSPIFMLACSLGTVYAIYPGITPYQLVDPVVGKKIDLWIQFTAAIPNFGVALLDIIDDSKILDKKKIGPSGKHWYHEWNKPDGSWLWHLSWLAFIPYLLCIYIFISLMHFPDCRISIIINGNPIIIGFICNTFNFVQEWTESVGFAGAGTQGTKKTGTGENDYQNDFNGDIAAFNVLFMFTIMVTCMFTED